MKRSILERIGMSFYLELEKLMSRQNKKKCIQSEEQSAEYVCIDSKFMVNVEKQSI